LIAPMTIGESMIADCSTRTARRMPMRPERRAAEWATASGTASVARERRRRTAAQPPRFQADSARTPADQPRTIHGTAGVAMLTARWAHSRQVAETAAEVACGFAPLVMPAALGFADALC
jgi:hypothetical protein